MNRVFLLTAGLCFALFCQAQRDTTGVGQKTTGSEGDTIRVGNLLIIRNGANDIGRDIPTLRIKTRRNRDSYRPSNISTNWGIVDLGIASMNDKTLYSSAAAQQFAPGANKDWFKQRYGFLPRSVDVNIWVFMQRINLVNHFINLKYGLGIELNNYMYEYNIRYLTDPTKVIMDTIQYSKNKLATDYLTLPVLLNFNFTPHRHHPFGISAGASFGYLYSSRQKLISHEHGKEKTFNDFDLNAWKISYIGELQLGWINLYGSYATRSIFGRGLDQVPYNFGVRIGNW
jgi:hypothetical protein